MIIVKKMQDDIFKCFNRLQQSASKKCKDIQFTLIYNNNKKLKILLGEAGIRKCLAFLLN